MAIQVVQITGDTVELVFNPAQDDLHVGENLSIVGRRGDRGLIVQIIELTAIFSSPLRSRHNQRISEQPQSTSPLRTNSSAESRPRRRPPPPPRETGGPYRAIAKIRRVTDPAWHPWDGWIPTRAVIVTRAADHEVLHQCIPASPNPLWLGNTLAGEPFSIERAALGAVNLIVGAKGSETSHLAQVILSDLIAQGVRCVVFDATGAYALLSPDSKHSSVSQTDRPAIVRLVVGESLKLGLPHSGLDAVVAMLRQFGLPKAIALYFESHVARHLEHPKDQDDSNQPPPFLGIDDLIRLAQDLEAKGQAVVGGAIVSCLHAIKRAQIFATQPAEAMAFSEGYAQLRHGGTLVIDLSRVPRRARTSIVRSLVGILRAIAERDSATESNHSLFMFFDDAQALVPRHFIADVLLPARPLGLTSFFVTTMVARLEDNLLYEADNLFLQQVASDDDIHLLARCGLVDADTLRGIGQRLRNHQSLLMGKATGGYPIIFGVKGLDGVELTSERSAFSRPAAAERADPSARAMRHLSTRVQTAARPERSLPLFPEDTPAPTVASEPYGDERISATSPPSLPTIAQVTAMWDRIVKRVARRRRILETILSAARPLRITGQRLILGFPPQHRFQQELVESEEYRTLLEDELKKAVGVSLEVTTEVYPA
jgi:hypothetical protein